MTDALGLLFDVDTFAVHDGPGIRMAVYLKGCPLSCAWCHSPESRREGPELVFVAGRCTLCGACVSACPEGVHEVTQEGHTLERALCHACGECARLCPSGALEMKGYHASASAIVEQARRLKPFFRHSGGGVTLTGGEITRQPAFVRAVLEGCRESGIHTAIETSGACGWARLEPLVELADLVLYDLKLADETQHRRWTGASNRQILRNAAHLTGREATIRVPLIPGITDSGQNLTEICRFMRDVGLDRLELLPYNPSAGAKYEWLGESYPFPQAEPQTPQRLRELRDLACAMGMQVVG